MARKRLSDLLREEAQKPADPETKPADAKQADEQPDNAPKQTSHSGTGQATTIEVEATAMATPEQTANDEKIVALEQALEETRSQINELNTKLAEVQAELKTQTATAKKLQTNLEQAEKENQQLSDELSEAKKTILQLAESNSQLQSERAALQTRPTSQSAPKPVPTSKPSGQLAAGSPLTQQEILRRRQAESLAHPVFPDTAKSPGQLSEQDLGWVD